MDIANPVLNKAPINDLYDALCWIDSRIREFGTNSIPDKFIINLRRAIGNLFPDYKISIMHLSNNTDKELFGVFINRRFNLNVLLTAPDMREIPESSMDTYDIDIDSKLFTMGFSVLEIASTIVYDIYSILNHEATLCVVSAYDAICAGRDHSSNSNILSDTAFSNLFKFCASDYLYRSRSIFTRNEGDLIRTPEILELYNLDEAFMSAMEKLFKHDYMVNRKNNPNPALSLNWMVCAIDRHTNKSTEILNVMNDFITSTGSSLIKISMNTVAKQLVDMNMKSRDIKVTKEASLFAGIRKSGLKSLENDLFEYEMRVKNIEDENSAIFLMRQINSRMGIIQDYLDEENLSESEMKRWQKLYDRYEKLRIAMTNKPIYSKKMYGLFVDYNALMNPSNDNIMTMNTMY